MTRPKNNHYERDRESIFRDDAGMQLTKSLLVKNTNKGEGDDDAGMRIKHAGLE